MAPIPSTSSGLQSDRLTVFNIPRRTHTAILAVLNVLAIGQDAWYWTQLPDRSTTRIGTDGLAHTPMDRTSGTLLAIAVHIGLPWMLVGVARSNRVLSDQIPNRDYWLTSDRRESSLAFMQKLYAATAIGLLLYFMADNHLNFVYAGSGVAFYRWQVALKVFYMFVLVLMVLVTWERFPRPKSSVS